MEEDKAIAYYNELTRKGERAAKFKQGLGYSQTPPLVKNSSNPSSFLSNFVPASLESQKRIQIENIQAKLTKKPAGNPRDRTNLGFHQDSPRREDDELHEPRGHRSSNREDGRRSRERNGGDSRRRCRSSSREDDRRDRDGNNSRRRRESRRRRRSGSSSGEGRGYGRRDGSDSERRRRRRRRRSRSVSSSEDEKVDKRSYRGRSGSGRERSNDLCNKSERLEKRRVEGKNQGAKSGAGSKERNADVDYERFIDGYAKMTPAERVKAKIKFQITEIVVKDTENGLSKDWERFDFNKEAPLDEMEVEVAEDDAALLQSMGKSFRLSAVEANREAAIQAAHDQAIFGAPSASTNQDATLESNKEINKENELGKNLNLISEKVFAMQQQGSWRDRARKLQDGSKN